MAIQITTLTAGYILIQAGHGVPNHVAPKGSQFTDVDTATLYFNKDGLSDWEVNIDVTNSGSTSGINTFSSFSSTTIGQGSVIATTSSDNLTFSGVNLSILVDNTNKILTLSATTPSNYTFTGGTVNGLTNFTNGLSATTISATTFYGNGANLTGISTQDTYLTGGTYSNGSILFTNNTGGTFNVNGLYTGYTTPIDIFTTGGTYSNSTGVTTFTNNTGGTFTVSGFFKTTDDIYTTGMTFNSSTYDLSITRNDGTSYNQSLAILASDMTITGGTYSSSTGIATFTNNTGGTFNVSGFLTGMTDTYTTGFTYSNNTLTIKRNTSQPDLSVMINNMTGLTVTGTISATTISATTYQNLPTDITVTGGTYSNGTTTFTNNTGGTFTVSGFKTSDLVVTGGTYNSGSILFTNNTGGTFNVTGLYTGYTAPIDVTVTGGTYNTNSGIATFTNNTGGTFTLTGFKTSDLVVTGGTYSNGSATFTNNTGGTFSVSGFKTDDVFVTGGTYSNGAILFTNNTGGTFNVNGLYTGYTAPIDITVTGGTYTNGTASFTNNTGGTFTVSGFKTSDLVVTGGTYTSGTATFTNNTGGTFTVSGFKTDDLVVTGGTYNNGSILFTNNTGGTFNVTGLYTGYTAPIDVTVTGGTYSNGTATFTNNTGGTFSVAGFKTDDIYTTGMTFNTSNYNLSITRNDGTSFTQSLAVLASDMTITGGTYSSSTGVATFTNNTGGTFSVSGFLTGQTDTYATGLTFSNNVLTLKQTNNQADLDILINNLSGLTVNGSLSATTFYGNGSNLTGLVTQDTVVTGGTYNSGSILFTNNTGGTFNVTGLYTGYTAPIDVYMTGATYSNNTFTHTNNTGGTFSVLFNTVTGLTVNGGLTANTINVTNYIDFNTGTTTPTNVYGRVFFDNTEHALSYNTSINQGVTVNMGQQNYIRVFNDSGVDIARGKALEVLSAYSGLPSVTLAVNKHTGFSVIGVSAEIIPNNSEGIAITYGIISDIELTGITIGSFVYASDTVPGKLDDPSKYLNFPLTARTTQIGYVVQSGTTTGKLFVDINNENPVLTLTDLERNVLEGNTLSTGLFEFTGMTTASTTTFNVAPLKGWLIKNTYEYATLPDVQSINYTGGTNISITNIASADSTYILIDSGLTITQQVTFPTPQQRRENIYLGKVNHPNRTSILNINNQSDYDVSPMSSLRDLWSPIKYINQGIIPSPNGANLSFNTSAGTLWGNGINWHNNQLNPNSVSISGKTPASFFYRTQTGGTSSSVTVIDPTKYEIGGVITSISPAGSNDATNQRIYLYPTGVINVLYGQTRYATLSEAVAAIQSETFIPYPNAETTGILIGVISVRNDIVADGEPLTNPNYAKFTLVSKFGESFGGTGGLSTTTLQQAYNNSTTPEIVINAILDGLSIQNGTGNADNTTHLIQGLNTAGNTTSFIRADGYISGTTFQSNGFIANTNGLTATTVSATTIQTPSFRANNGGITATTVSATTYYNLPNTTLQQAYTASTNPEFTINSTQLGIQFRNDTGDDNTPMIVIQNNAGISKGEWRADGTLYTTELYSSVISATTYQNLPIDVIVTGGTYSNATGIATFTNNTGGTFTVNGFNTGGGTFTGGTVTGATSFTSGLTTSTISATTYYNLPTDVIVTGGTYSDGTTIFTNNTGGTFNITGYYTGYTAPLDVFVTGGTYSNGSLLFTNNTGGTFNVNTSTNYAAGVISGATYTSTGTGQINLPAIKVALYNNANNIEPIIVYDVTSGTTGSGGIPSLIDQDTNYVVVEYNGGSPRYYVYDNDGMVDDSSTVLFMVAYRATNFVHTLEFGNQGAGLVNKLNDRFIMTDRFGYESGLALSLSASTGIVMASAGVAWNGPNRQSLTEVDSSGSTFFKNYHSGGTWTYTTTGETINNTYYDNGTNIVSATASKFLTNWYFRGQEINSHLYEVYSTSEYDNVALAQLATEPSLPELITSHAILLGRIIIEVGATTGLTESAFGTVFQSTQVTSHNDLFGLQGGSAGQYYHLNSNQYNNLALTNIDNIFGTGQSFISGLTANTISATTYYNLPIDVYVTGFTYDNANTFTITNNTGGTLTTTVNTMTGLTVNGTVTATNLVGDGTGITNIPIPYGLINAISSGNFLI